MTFRTPLPLLFALLLALGLVGCDSSPGPAADGTLLVPNTSTLDFQTEQGDADTLQVTLVYQNLSERPAPDDDVPEAYTITTLEETGTPADGSSLFSVVFTAPEETGAYTVPVRFRAGPAVTTVRFDGISVGGAEPITDFSGDETGFISFNGDIRLSLDAEQLRIDMTNVGGSGNFPGMFTVLDGPVNFEPTPVVAVRMKATASSDGPARVRAALNQYGDVNLPDANATVPDLLASVPADDQYRTYYFDFRDNFVQFDGQPVPPSNIGELVLLFNDNYNPTFTGTLYIDSIERRPDIPDGEGGANLPPTADFTFSPQAPTPGETVTFADRSTDPDGFIESFEWAFGDGTTATGVEVTHTYAEAGTYTATLTVTDDAGATAQTSATVEVGQNGGSTDAGLFDNFEDGIQDGEYFTFTGGGVAIGLAEESDVPAGAGGSIAMRATITGGDNGYAGYGKGKAINLADVGDDPYFNMYVRTDAPNAFTLEINLQEDQDLNGSYDGSGPVDDEFQFDVELQNSSEYTLISIPVSSFQDSNDGGDGSLSDNIAALVFAIGGITDANYTLDVDEIVFTAESLGGSTTQQ